MSALLVIAVDEGGEGRGERVSTIPVTLSVASRIGSGTSKTRRRGSRGEPWEVWGVEGVGRACLLTWREGQEADRATMGWGRAPLLALDGGWELASRAKGRLGWVGGRVRLTKAFGSNYRTSGRK